ncbi:hypothetical protein [Sphaerimonospora thailandensis]|uniref:Uncharacterized protein n=1 Tax=Sphaerimonospora thailandensis TaxID=795644 RepID=A0A8J3RAE6_9ACTN|nr:hypothetical protein [Sphaerimonospora thailandensis]GIH70314.1 hypothetical protein Mth01_25670 [Sphaerimonospora thailandensis]
MTSFVGLPTPPGAAGCAFAPDIDREGCVEPATVHVIGRAEGWGWVALHTCGAHLSIAKAGCVEIADEHPAEGCSGEHYAPTTTEEPNR